MKKILKILLVSIAAPILSLSFFGNVFAASNISVVSDVQTASIGQQFSVSLLLDAGENINAAQGIVSYSPSVLQMVSVDNSKSIFNFWVEDPTISNDAGTMSFIGGNPKSMSGANLNILTMTFKAIGIGTSAIKFSNGIVTADDGQGSNVLANTTQAMVTVSGTSVTPEAAPVAQPQPVVRKPVVAGKIPSAPKLSVPLYPDQSQWYSQIGDVNVFWDLPDDVVRVAVSVDKNPNGKPTVFEKSLFNGKNIGTLSEGISYVHVKFENNIGSGPVSTYKISIDKTPPLDFTVQMPEGLKIDDPSPAINFVTSDSLSGIAFYSIIVDAQQPIKNQTGTANLPILGPGKHSVLVRAFDNAGNATDASLNFEILPIASPVIQFVTQPFYSDSDNVLLVRGSGLPNTLALISIMKSDGTVSARASTKADAGGAWEYSFSNAFQNGKYQIIVRSQDDRGALSLPITFNNVVVSSKPILKFGFIELSFLDIVIILILLLIGSFMGGYYFFKLKAEKINRKVFVTQQDVIKVTDMIKKDMEDLKKALKTEDKFDDEFAIKELEKNIAKIDTYIRKEVEDIEK